tara:strand:- start:938 stop:2410 length:1473 start_codon:yes stop_codon:yes gene_type:complete
MSIVIQYPNQFSKEFNDLIIVISKINELNNINNLPINAKLLYHSKDFTKILKDNRFYQSFLPSNNYKIFYNVKIVLINILKNDQFILEGSKLFLKFNKNSNKVLNIVFSNKLFKNYNDLCSNFVFGFLLKSYSFQKYKNNNNKFEVKTINIFNSKKSKLKNFNNLNNLLTSINYTKDLVSEPANILNPYTYAKKCLELKKIGLKIKILNKKQIEKIGMNSLLGVAEGSIYDPRIVIFEWNLKIKSKPIILVGKGITFDTGGISLKPSGGMEEMITDMGGSAVVVGSMMNAALNKIKKPLVGIIGLVENMPDGKAQRPGDIVKSLSGQTIEVLNTDAEGRLILADMLTYAQKKYKPKEIIDFATLTGAIMVALGTYKAGLFSNNNNLANKIFKSGEITNENVWRLPLSQEYDRDINSSRADMQNIGSRYGGSITAAQFLQRFIENKTPWAHLDIAGVTWNKKIGKSGYSALHSPGATAFGVRLINQFLTTK